MPDVSIMAAAAPLKPVLDDLYKHVKSFSSTSFKRWKNAENLNNLYRKINSVLKVKTIWQLDKNRSVNLKNFYYPAKIEGINGSIPYISKLDEQQNIIIEGTVGQGKSMFMRYMTAQEMRKGKRIPVFFELRHIKSGENLKVNIIRSLKVLGFDCNEKLFDIYAKSGKFIFFLDGFDEIPSNMSSEIVKELSDLSEEYENLQIILSTRPDTGIQYSAQFDLYKLAPLSQQDLPKIIKKISGNNTDSEAIVSAIKSSATDIISLLETPLLVTLLVMSYRSEKKIPERLTEFYDALFTTLVYRHDQSKPGYTRERYCQLNERELESAFSALCFSTRKEQQTSFTRKEIFYHCQQAKNLSGEDFSPDHFLSDITKVTCLLIHEGFKYHFVHKSVQEFFTANFIRTLTEESAEKLYGRLRGGRWEDWIQEIRFLEEIDKYRCYKYFLEPVYREELKCLLNDDGTLNKQHANYILQLYMCSRHKNEFSGSYNTMVQFIRSDYYPSAILSGNIFAMVCRSALRESEPGDTYALIMDKAEEIMRDENKDTVFFHEIFEKLGVLDNAKRGLLDFATMSQRTLTHTQSFIAQKESVTDHLDI